MGRSGRRKIARSLKGGDLVLVYVADTDGDVVCEGGLSMAEVEERVRRLRLSESDYAVLEGRVVKDFQR